MGWAYCGKDSLGREIGYAIQSTCDKRGCDVVIDRGLSYACGGMHNADNGDGCGMYFCAEHLFGLDDRGRCQHRQYRAYGHTFCQLLAHETPNRHNKYNPSIEYFACACGRYEYRGPTVGMSLDEWRKVPGYLVHLEGKTLVTDMKQSGEEWAFA